MRRDGPKDRNSPAGGASRRKRKKDSLCKAACPRRKGGSTPGPPATQP